jgi:hypothetical protein
MPRAKLRKGGKWHEQHRLCCVTHGLRVRLLQSGTVCTKAGASVDTGWFNHSLRVTSRYLTTLVSERSRLYDQRVAAVVRR